MQRKAHFFYLTAQSPAHQADDDQHWKNEPGFVFLKFNLIQRNMSEGAVRLTSPSINSGIVGPFFEATKERYSV